MPAVEATPVAAVWIDDDGRKHIPMLRDEFYLLPEAPPSFEWCRGEAIEMNEAIPAHQRAIKKLVRLLDDAFEQRGLEALPSLELNMPYSVRIPDVALVTELEIDVVHVHTPPLIVVEILSPSTRRTDLTAKATEYAEFGVEQYWIVDLDVPSITLQQNLDGNWITTTVLTRENPTAEIKLPGHGTVELNINQVIRPSQMSDRRHIPAEFSR